VYPDAWSNFWPVWDEFALVCLAVALLAATVQSLLGPIGTLLTVVVVVFLGNPSIGGVNGTAYLPTFGGGSARSCRRGTGRSWVRNTLCFHGNAITVQLLVLGIYVVAGAALVIILAYDSLLWWHAREDTDRAQRREPISPEETGMAGCHRQRHPRWRFGGTGGDGDDQRRIARERAGCTGSRVDVVARPTVDPCGAAGRRPGARPASAAR
jgi:Flp pilus assembly protein TadB